MSGTHPVLFPTAGKHHLKCEAGVSIASVDVVLMDRLCLDPHRGDGPLRIPSHLFQVSNSLLPVTLTAAANVCEYVASGGSKLLAAPRLQPLSLENLGFPGQFLTLPFFAADPPWGIVGPGAGFTWDADGDGLSEVSHVEDEIIKAHPVDLCGLDRVVTGSDPDADKLRGKCDPDPSFRQKYVGIGEPGFPPVPAPKPNWSTPVHAYGGFWDQDQDHAANGFDGCPTLVAKSQGISNRWAEDVNWPPGEQGNHEFGFFQRGDTCDPYPVSLTKWKKTFQRSAKCGPPRFVTSGSDYALTRTAAARGASANDAYWDTKQPEMSNTWLGNGYRCACRDALTGAPISGPACVLNQASECFRNDVAEANRQLYTGRGWRALDRAGCARSHTWCDPIPLPVPRFDVGQSSSHWAWTQETTAFPAGTATQHFSPGDLISVPGSLINGAHVRAQREYALWSLVELQQHLGLPKRASAPFIDPEFDPRAFPLQNTASQMSRLVRSSLSEQTLSGLTSAHSSLSAGITCGLLTLEQQLSKVKLWFGPDPVLPERYGVSQLRALVHGDGPLLSAAVLRPTEGNYATLSLGDVAMDSWLSSSSVGITPLATDRLVSGPLPGLASLAASERDPIAEPDLFVFERGVGDRPARFARLAPVEVTTTSARYEVVRFGELRGTVSTAAEVVTDAEGRVAAVVDFHNDFVEAVLPDGALPMRHALPVALSGRSDAALALRGNLLLVAGGLSDAGLHQDLWLLDLYSGTARELRADLPPRRGALLSVTPSGSHVLYAGGFDAAGASHDDVWQLAGPAAPPGEAKPAQLYADTSAASVGLSASALALDPIGGELLRVTYEPTAVEGLALATRTNSGWERLDDTGEVQRCAAQDSPGGKLCSLSAAWWASVGRTACESTSCQGSAGALLGTAKLLPPIVAADVSAEGAWLARPHRVEFVGATEPSTLGATRGAAVHERPWDIAARGATALLTTREGVRLAILEGESVALGEELALCGTPFDVEALAEDTWAVMTTVGLAIVGGGVTTPLRVLSMSLLVPAGPQGTLLALGTDASAEWACKLAKPFAHAAGALKAITALAPVERGRVLVSYGKHVFDVDASNAAEPALRDVLHLKLPLFALRADARGGRAYGLGAGPKHRPIIDLHGEQLVVTGAHDVAHWVMRRDAGALRLGRHGAWAELAWVAP